MKPLQQVRVLDLTRLLPGPYTSSLLADLGAEVIKVESPLAPDFLRSLPELFELINRNKRSLTVRYDRPEGAALVRRLAARCDVFLESNRPGVMAGFGLDEPTLRAENPGLLYLSLTGYGQNGPLAARAGHDLNFLARTGLAAGLGPNPGATQMADFSGGLLGAMAVLAGLLERQKTGVGRRLDVALADGCIALAPAVFARMRPPGLQGESPMYRSYQCADGRWLAVGALEKKFQDRMLQALGMPPLATDLFLAPDPAWHTRLEEIFAEKPLSHWQGVFAEADACVEPILEPGEVRMDAWASGRGLANGLFSPSFGPSERRPASASGADAPEILTEMGLTQGEIAELRASGALG